MLNLGDYLGHLLSEIAIARMHADLETVRIAELYAAHPLLRSMPVPHVRMPDVDLEIPVLVDDVEDLRAGESARGSAAVPDLRKKFDDVLGAHLARSGISLAPADATKLTAALDSRLLQHDLPAEVSVGVLRLADDLSAAAVKAIEDARPGLPAIEPDRVKELKEAARAALLQVPRPPPRVRVLVTSSQIRESATADNLTKLRVKISEQGVEWTTMGIGADRQDKLVPE
jgi:hypothetical protein